ncbi:hypothetical protein Acr_16g0001580 [Actinidia rufa]|uniref:S phase cyclin A-associated protein in the endoplasmic reticulum N-terminal domain-containing protein n=1 Tax=Actinidia rufa TaxID=165716 RepID=A0A7J0FYA6_9ERIC|nr:hypothetical protein Acr_16g0001580 [Actinidia rufa]
MESSGEAGDDQGSGWLQVKKKHRSSSKFSLQGWVGGFSGKQTSNVPHSQASSNAKSRHSRGKHGGQLSKAGVDFSVHSQGSIATATSVSNEEEKGMLYLDKCVVCQDNEIPKSPLMGASTDCDNKAGVAEELPQKNKPDHSQKIKWGDLNDEALALHLKKNIGAEIRFGDIGNDHLVSRKAEDANASVSRISSSSDSKGNKLVVSSIDAGHGFGQSLSLSPGDEENCIEVNEVSSEDVKAQITNEKIINSSSDVSKRGTCLDQVKSNSNDPIDASSLSGSMANEQDGMMVEISVPTIMCKAGAFEISDIPVPEGVFKLCDSPPRWAADELYLLCELECDLEQMKEAILVLDEAASDFKELKSRVEKFEQVKRTSQSIDGLPVTMKSDHRRPHALSWEVRRMTTSPHRAEILSSSLEAFRKIQQERANMRLARDAEKLGLDCPSCHHITDDIPEKLAGRSYETPNAKEAALKSTKQSGVSDLARGSLSGERRNSDASRLTFRESSAASVTAKSRREQIGFTSEIEKLPTKKDKMLPVIMAEKNPKSVDHLRKQISLSERDKEKRNGTAWKSMDAWKEKRNWVDILASPFRVSSRFSHSPGMSRKSAERTRILHDKLMSPEKKKKNALDLKKEAEEKHARAMRIRSELENERVQKLQRNSEKLNRVVNEWQAVRSTKLREGMHARQQRGESRHEAFLAQVVRRAGDESSKVNEVRFITSLNEENKKLMLRQKLHDSELRRAEKLQKSCSVLLRRNEKRDEAQVRREEERKASSAAREAKAIEQLRRKAVRAKAQQEEAELLAQKLAERLSESEQRRKFYLEQIRERASMDFRDQSSPLLRRSSNKEGRSTPISSVEDYQRRIKRIRQRLMSLKYEYPESPAGVENAGIGYRTAVGTARAKIGRWIQELQRLRQARKEGAASIGLITADMIKFLEGKEPELHASRQAGLLDFIASALPASHTSKPETCQVTIYLLRLLRVVLSVPANKGYFLAQNLLPPTIPMLAAALENYIKIAAGANVSSSSNLLSSKTSVENLESISEALDGFLWTVAAVIGHGSADECQLQMQDGLQELVIAYQVVHRSRTISSIDLESFPIDTVPENGTSEAKLLEASGSGCSPETNPNGDNGPQPSALEGIMAVLLPDVPDHRPLDESHTTKKFDESVLDVKDSNKLEVVSTGMDVSDIQDESQHVLIDTAKYSVSKKDEKNNVDDGTEKKNEDKLGLKPPVTFLLSAISETGLVCLPSLLTAVLLQANNRLSSEHASYVLPSNFEEVATGVLRVLNNLALIDITFMQRILARPDLKMEYFHLMSFLLSHCTSKWRTATDKVSALWLSLEPNTPPDTNALIPLLDQQFSPKLKVVRKWDNNYFMLYPTNPFVDTIRIPSSGTIASDPCKIVNRFI